MKKSIKRIAIIVMAMLMLVTAMPLDSITGTELFVNKASAEELTPTGQCGENVYWTFDSETGLLTISGEGKMYNYQSGKTPFSNEGITDIVIDEGVTSVGDYAFLYKNSAENINIPSTVESIGTSAFVGCKKLLSINIKGNLKSIGAGAFGGCDLLETITIPNTLERVGNTAFSRCESLKDIYYLGNISDWCKIEFGTDGESNPKNHADNIYFNGQKETKLIIPDSITSISQYAFNNFNDLEEISIPSTVVSFGKGAFTGCSNIKKVNYLGSVYDWLKIDFENMQSNPSQRTTTTITFNDEVVSEITLPSSMREIKPYTLSGLNGLNKIVFSDRISELPEETLSNCIDLRNITLPNSIDKIGDFAFNNCKKIERVDFLGTFDDWYNIEFSQSISTPLYYGGKIYFNGEIVKEFTVPENEITIPKFVFYNMSDLQKVYLPDSLEKIPFDAFYGCSSLSECNIPQNVISIGMRAFYHCESLEKVTIPDGITELKEQSIFEGCSSLSDVVFSPNLTSIGYRDFIGCRNLKSIELPYGITTINSQAFMDCTSLEEMIIPDTIRFILKDSVLHDNLLKNIYYTGSEEQWNSISGKQYLENYYTTIHYNYGQEIGTCGDEITWSFNTISGKLFVEGTGDMLNCETFDDYGWYSFKDDISYVEISDGITGVGTNAFSGCSGLKEVYLGGDVVSVGENAFADCTSLVNVSVNAEVISAENAFSNNDSRLTFIINDKNSSAETLAKELRAKVITAKLVSQTVFFDGTTIVYDNLEYNYITNLINKYSSATRIYFTRLEFYGVKADEIIIEDCTTVDRTAENFSLRNLYVYIYAVKDDENISFDKMFKLLSNEEYDAFRLKFVSDNTEEESVSLSERIHDFIDELVTSALRVITKAINFVVGIFKKK